MAKKEYWPTARLVLGVSKRYIERNALGLQANLTESQWNCIQAVLNAIIECLTTLPKPTLGE